MTREIVLFMFCWSPHQVPSSNLCVFQCKNSTRFKFQGVLAAYPPAPQPTQLKISPGLRDRAIAPNMWGAEVRVIVAVRGYLEDHDL